MGFWTLGHQGSIFFKEGSYLGIESRLSFGPSGRGRYRRPTPYEKIRICFLAVCPCDDGWRFVGTVFCPF